MKQCHSVPGRGRQTSQLPHRHHHHPRRQPISSPPKTNIFSLPNELLLTIFEHCHDDRVPSLKILCLVNRRFKDLARRLEQQQQQQRSRIQIQDRPPSKARSLLFYAEKHLPYLFPKGHLPCYRCFRVLDNTGQVNFIDTAVRRHRGMGGSERRNRFCLDCGVTRPLFGPHQVLVVRGSRWEMCGRCWQLKPCRSPWWTGTVHTDICSHEILRRSPRPRARKAR